MGEELRNIGVFLTLVFILSCSLIFNIQVVGAEEELVAGVKPGDWMKYRYVSYYATNPERHPSVLSH